jgi:drug/metabolite transporter (DMT)-like permease
MVGAAFLFATMAAGVQTASAKLPNAMVVFFRNLVALLVLAPFALRGGLAGLRTSRFPEHLLRTVAGLSSMYCAFYAIGHLPLADALLLSYTLPLFIPLVEWVWLKQPMPRAMGAPLAVGFAGVLLVLKPGVGLYQSASLVGVAGGMLGAIAQTGIRRMTVSEPTVRIVFYFSRLCTLASAVPLGFVWVNPGLPLLGLLALMGTCAVGGQLLLTRAYAYAPAAQVGAFIYVAVIFAMLFDWIGRGKLPDATSLAGAVLICGGGAAMLRLGRRAVPAPGPGPTEDSDLS